MNERIGFSASTSVSTEAVPTSLGTGPALAVTVLEPPPRLLAINLAELWRHRELLYFLVWRDVKVRYKQTALGAAWAVLQPTLTMVVFTLFFGRLAKVPSDGVPYALFTYCALVPWTFFANGVTQSADSLVGNANLLRNVYFPRLAIPMASVLAGLVDLVISFGVLVVLLAAYGRVPTASVLWLPAFVLLALITALGVGLWLTALNVQFRDVRYVVPFLVQMWLFATPVAYPSTLLQEPWRTVYGLNPMVGVVEGFRWALLGTATRPAPVIAVSAVMALLLLITGALYFRSMERTFADRV
jgi:lipopolysaccharide transport system permease protein